MITCLTAVLLAGLLVTSSRLSWCTGMLPADLTKGKLACSSIYTQCIDISKSVCQSHCNAGHVCLQVLLQRNIQVAQCIYAPACVRGVQPSSHLTSCDLHACNLCSMPLIQSCAFDSPTLGILGMETLFRASMQDLHTSICSIIYCQAMQL